MYYADSMAFFGRQGESPRFDRKRPPTLQYAHLTSAPPFSMPIEETFKRHEEFKFECLANPDTRPILWRDQLEFDNDTLGCVFGFQHAPAGLTADWMMRFSHAGVRFMSLAYKGPTEYGSGFLEDGPLTDAGKQVIHWMAEYGITLDVSHLSDRTAREALTFIWKEKLPMKPCASHSGCRAVYPHPRNASDEVLRMLDELDGYIGIPTISFFLVPKEELPLFYQKFGEHVEHALHICDDDRVGIGSDGIHADMSMEAAEANFKRLTGALQTDGQFGEYHPDREPELIENGSSMFECLEHALHQGGFADDHVDGVCGDNFVEYLKRTLPE